SRKRPLLVFLEDLHGADDRTLSAVEALAGEIGSFRILLIASYRSEEASEGLSERMGRMRTKGRCDVMELGGLSEEDMPEMVEDVAGPVEVPKLFLSELHRRTGGHPLFIVEMLKLLDEKGVFAGRKVVQGWERSMSRVPSLVRDVLRRRVDRLSEEDVKLLEWASVQGEVFSVEMLSSPLRMEKAEVLTRLGELERRHRMVHAVQEGYRFDHVLLRDVLYEGMAEGLRREVHGRIGEVLRERYGEDVEPVLFELAHHVVRSADYDKAAGYLLRAGEKAQTLYDSEGAVVWYRRALEALEKSETGGSKAQKTEVYERLGDAYRLCGRPDEAIESYTRLLETAKDRGVRSRAKQRIGWVYQGKHEAAAALRYLKEALEELGEEGRSVEAARIYLNMAMVHRLHGVDYDRAFALSEEALQILEGTDHLRELARAYRGVGFFYGTKGEDSERGMDVLQRSLELSEKAGDLYDAAMP
ncbi:MAG TPA: tetratricopeptide repeat protein, partial [Candidatus Latescibacteria bacterium]|nr:tetratricopeptide repeat protein [Candidatus Latescibacterota bacterium]